MATTTAKKESGLLGLLLRGLFLGTAHLIKFHIWYPLQFATAYLLLLALPFITTALRFGHGSLGAAVLALIPLACIFLMWKYLPTYIAEFKARRWFRGEVFATMRETIWKDENLSLRRHVKVTRSTLGNWRVDFKAPRGMADAEVLKTLDIFRSDLGLASTVVLADENPNDGLVSVLFCYVDPLTVVPDGSAAPVLHLTAKQKSDPYQWISIGTDALGQPYEVPLFLKEGGSVRQLCAGRSGSGKSSIVRQQVLQAILNPNIDLVMFDGKGSEFGIFEPYAKHFGRTKSEFFEQLRFLQDEVTRRGKVLNENKLTQMNRASQSWNPEDDGNFLLWVWDEIGATMAGFSVKERVEANDKIYGILSVARSLGIGAIVQSQTFKSDLLATQIRDNCFDVALGYQQNTAQEAAYLGFEVADEITPAKINGKILKTGVSTKVGTFAMRGIDREAFGRSYWIDDNQIRSALAEVSPAK